jgi:hypothetical protein
LKLKPRNYRNKRAVSPVISTVIITATIIALVMVAVVFANNFLSARLAESDFSAAKQFMQTVGMQIDDVAWRIGQTETIRYSSRYGDINVLSNVSLMYTISITTLENPIPYVFYTNTTQFVFFNMPISQYSVTNNYYEQIWPSQVSSLTLKGSSASTSRVFAIEKLPMPDGNYVRVVTAPTIRLVNSTIETANNSTFYFKLYLPLLSLESAPKKSQSVTLTGDSISIKTQNHIKSISITVSFPQAGSGWDNTFFHFPTVGGIVKEDINAPSGYTDCVIELYAGAVSVSLGAHV